MILDRGEDLNERNMGDSGELTHKGNPENAISCPCGTGQLQGSFELPHANPYTLRVHVRVRACARVSVSLCLFVDLWRLDSVLAVSLELSA